MRKNSMLYKGVLFEDSLENYLSRENTSICQFLYFLCIEDIAKHVERTFYTNKSWHFKYSVSSMIKFFVVKCFRKRNYSGDSHSAQRNAAKYTLNSYIVSLNFNEKSEVLFISDIPIVTVRSTLAVQGGLASGR